MKEKPLTHKELIEWGGKYKERYPDSKVFVGDRELVTIWEKIDRMYPPKRNPVRRVYSK